MTKECRELKNIEYQNMLLNHTVKKEKKEDNISNIDNFLQQEKMSQKKKNMEQIRKSTKNNKTFCRKSKILPTRSSRLTFHKTSSGNYIKS